MMTSINIYSITQKRDNKPAFRLLLDNTTIIQIGDKPVFGAEVTISEKITNLVGSILLPGMVIGWVNYVDASKFACITQDNHYIEAAKYLYTKQNQLILAKSIELHSIELNMRETKHIFTFSEAT